MSGYRTDAVILTARRRSLLSHRNRISNVLISRSGAAHVRCVANAASTPRLNTMQSSRRRRQAKPDRSGESDRCKFLDVRATTDRLINVTKSARRRRNRRAARSAADGGVDRRSPVRQPHVGLGLRRRGLHALIGDHLPRRIATMPGVRPPAIVAGRCGLDLALQGIESAWLPEIRAAVSSAPPRLTGEILRRSKIRRRFEIKAAACASCRQVDSPAALPVTAIPDSGGPLALLDLRRDAPRRCGRRTRFPRSSRRAITPIGSRLTWSPPLTSAFKAAANRGSGTSLVVTASRTISVGGRLK